MGAPLTIGDFSRITHLSVKTLRYYHQVGLLEPDEVNETTGYRYYSLGQVTAAHAIRRFRDLGMPVNEVRAVLRTPDTATRNALLTAHLDRMQAQLEQTRAAIASLRRLLADPSAAVDVERREVPATPAIAISAVVSRDRLLDWWTASLHEVHGAVRAGRLVATGPAGGLYDNALFTDERGGATVFIPVADPTGVSHPAEPFTVPAAHLAVAVHPGSHNDVDRTYAALGTYVAERDLGVDGPVREYYPVGAAQTADVTRWRTEICWPVR